MRMIPTQAREELGAAQFVLGPESYPDWVWKEREKSSTPPPKSSGAWPFRRWEMDANVVEMKPRKKK